MVRAGPELPTGQTAGVGRGQILHAPQSWSPGRRIERSRAVVWAVARERVLTGRACECRNWHGARATSSVDGWASMALRSDVVEAAGVRSSERRRPTRSDEPGSTLSVVCRLYLSRWTRREQYRLSGRDIDRASSYGSRQAVYLNYLNSNSPRGESLSLYS